jgi:hypothetical protein
MLIDVAKTIMFYSKDSNIPLSVLEMFENNKKKNKVIYKSFLESNKLDKDRIDYYYLEPSRAPFLICNYSNRVYDSYLDRFQSILPIFVIHFWLVIVRKSYYYLFPLNDIKKDLAYDK